MAPRSYLSRIAQPLVDGDPVVWSVPRATAEEARPPVAATAATSALQRRPAPAPAAKPASTSAPTPKAGPEIRAWVEPNPRLVELTPSAETLAPAPIDELSPAELAISEPAAATAPVTRQAIAEPAVSPSSERRLSVISGEVAATPPTAEMLPAPPPSTRPAPRCDSALEPQWPTREEASSAPHAERVTPSVVNTPAPRLHIGAIEIRAIAPPPVAAPAPAPIMAAAAPSAPGGRIGRAYAWRFGLVQG
jgi:hypothetical protein